MRTPELRMGLLCQEVGGVTSSWAQDRGEWGFSVAYIGQLPVAGPRSCTSINRYQWVCVAWGTAFLLLEPQFLPLTPPHCRLLLLPVAPMAEDWLDCPALGPGWKRREVFRKSGATCGRSDTYYQRYWVGCGQSQE